MISQLLADGSRPGRVASYMMMTTTTTTTTPTAGHSGDAAAAIRRLQRLSRMMDTSFRLPGTRFRFGLDPLLGLIPGVGDFASAAISAYIIYEGWRLGATGRQLTVMIFNVAIDALVGSIPLIGDLFDFALKANQRNLRVLGIAPEC